MSEKSRIKKFSKCKLKKNNNTIKLNNYPEISKSKYRYQKINQNSNQNVFQINSTSNSIEYNKASSIQSLRNNNQFINKIKCLFNI